MGKTYPAGTLIAGRSQAIFTDQKKRYYFLALEPFSFSLEGTALGPEVFDLQDNDIYSLTFFQHVKYEFFPPDDSDT